MTGRELSLPTQSGHPSVENCSREGVIGVRVRVFAASRQLKRQLHLPRRLHFTGPSNSLLVDVAAKQFQNAETLENQPNAH